MNLVEHLIVSFVIACIYLDNSFKTVRLISKQNKRLNEKKKFTGFNQRFQFFFILSSRTKWKFLRTGKNGVNSRVQRRRNWFIRYRALDAWARYATFPLWNFCLKVSHWITEFSPEIFFCGSYKRSHWSHAEPQRTISCTVTYLKCISQIVPFFYGTSL